MKLGISSYTYTWAIGVPGYPVAAPMTAFGLLDKAAELGVSVVQIADNLSLDMLDDEELSALVSKAMKSGIQMEIGTRGIRPDHLATYLQLAKRFASSILRVVIDTTDHHPALPEVIDLLRESLPTFVEARITLAIENHDRFSFRDFCYILESVDNSHLGICLDTVNSFGALEGPEVVVDALSPWTVNLHIKDFNIRRPDHMMGFVVEGTPAGGGRLDLPWLLEKLQFHRREYNAILELWTPPETDMPATIAKEDRWAEESIVYLRKFITE